MMAGSLYQTLPDLISTIGQSDFYHEVERSFKQVPTVSKFKIISYPKSSKPAFLGGYSEPEFDRIYCDSAYLLDPFYDVINKDNRNELVTLDSIIRHDFHSSTYYDRFYHMTGWTNESNFIVSLNDERTICLAYTAQDMPMNDLNHELRPYLRAIKSAIRKHESLTSQIIESAHCSELKSEHHDSNHQMSLFGLTKREKEIVSYILQGHPSSSIAQLCYVSEGTIKNHRKNIYRKLNIHTQGELFRKFLN